MTARLCLYTLWNGKNEPLASGLNFGGITKICRFYLRGHGITVHAIEETKKIFRKAICKALTDGIETVTCNFKQHLAYFDLPIERGIDYPVYDVCWPNCTKVADAAALEQIVADALKRMATMGLRPWQKTFANAAVVYQSMENSGISLAGFPAKPIWSQQTFSGRSKTSAVNLQGQDGSIEVRNGFGLPNDSFLCFDWLAADIRVAAYLSKDELLTDSFNDSDPYSVIESLLTGDDGEVHVNRDECKAQLLKAINRLDVDHPIVTEVFPKLGEWLRLAKVKLANDGWLETVFGRRFNLANAKNELAVLNGTFQGSVAHAMQAVIKKVWDRYGNRLMAEVHDSIVVTCPRPDRPMERRQLTLMVRDVAGIMTRPFAGILDDDPFFPVRVSAGEQWRQWRPDRIYRAAGVENLSDDK